MSIRGSIPAFIHVLVVLLAVACGYDLPAQDAREALIAEATLAAWASEGLPSVPDDCGADAFQMRFPATQDEFWQLCPKALGCFRWENVQPCELCETVSYPTAVVSPKATPGELVLIGVHELAHALVDCALRRPYPDPYDAGHTKLVVWGDEDGFGTEDSVVRRALDSYAEWEGGDDDDDDDDLPELRAHHELCAVQRL